MEIKKGIAYKMELGYVYDGDSFNLKLVSPAGIQSQSIICRSQWIDTPESQKPNQTSSDPLVIKHWEWAEKAKLALMNLIQGKTVIAIPFEQDMYRRWVCDVYIDSVALTNNVEVKQIQAWLAVFRLPFNRHTYNLREVNLLRGS